MAFYIRKSWHKLYIIKYIMSFKNITPEEYQRLINNKNKIYDLTFKTPELLNRYRNDKNIYDEIKYNEKQNKKLKDYDKVFHENLDRYFIENADKKKIEEISKYNYNILKKKEKELEDKDINLILMDEKLKDKDNEIKEIRKDYLRDKYKFDNDENIIKSFETIFKENKITYKPYKKSKNTQIKYLLDKLDNHEKLDRNLYDYFYDTLENKKKLSHKIPIKKIINHQNGEGLLNTNKIKINTDLLNKNILSIRYLTGKKLTNKLLKDDYKISKNMVNAIKFNKDIHKLSKNEKNVYYELQKYLNKDQDINILIGSYLAGNNSKDLFNKINKILYDKYKNNLITQKEYTDLLSKINNV